MAKDEATDPVVEAEPDSELTEDGELAAVRAENERLRTQLESHQAKGSMWRRILSGFLAVLAIIAVVAAVDAVWMQTTLQDEDQFVETLQPLPQEDAVAESLSIRVADGVVETAGVESFVSETLPEELSVLVPPMTNSIRDMVATIANELIQSDAMATAWTTTLRVTHKSVSAVLTGNDAALVAEEGTVAVDLDEVAGVVVEEVEATGLVLPDIDVALGRIVLYEDENLAEVQTIAEGIARLGWLLPVLALILIAGAIVVAPNRRKMTAVLGFGTALALLVSLASLRIARGAILNGIEDGVQSDAAGQVWDTILARLIQSTWALLVLALIVGFAAWVSGPSARASGLRGWTVRTLDRWRRPEAEQPEGFAAFLTEWKRTIQVLVVAAGLLFLVFGPNPSGLLVIITAAVVLAILVVVEVFAGPQQPAATPTDNDGLEVVEQARE